MIAGRLVMIAVWHGILQYKIGGSIYGLFEEENHYKSKE